jgi:hypothetical protein
VEAMAKLYESCDLVLREIEKRGLDPYKTRGAIALQTGFLISAIRPDDPDDPDKIESLRNAAWLLLQLDIGS